MNKVVITTVVLLILCTCVNAHLEQTVSVGAADPLIRVEPADITVSPGEHFTVDIDVDTLGSAVSGVDFVLGFNQSLLNATAVTSGDFFGGFSTWQFSEINNTLGIVDFGEAILGDENVTESGTVASISFQAIGTHGTSNLAFQTVTISDPLLNPLPTNATGGTVTIVPPPTPFIICGYIFYDLGMPCTESVVTITNVNTSEYWNAETSASSHYYQLSLTAGVNVSVGEVVQVNASGPYGAHPAVSYHKVTQEDVNTGGLYNFNLTIETEPVSFDTGASDEPYPSINGVHNGTIKPNRLIAVNTLSTYSCPRTGGHAEYVRLWGNGVDAVATWNGYAGDWHNLMFNCTFVLQPGITYSYTLRTGSYNQIIHAQSGTYQAAGGDITCHEFRDANGIIHENWIPAFRLWQEGG